MLCDHYFVRCSHISTFVTGGAIQHFELVRHSEVMVRLTYLASEIKMDDSRLKGLPIGSCFCINCDLRALEDCRHLIMQCPYQQDPGMGGGGGGGGWGLYKEIRQVLLEVDTLMSLLSWPKGEFLKENLLRKCYQYGRLQ